MSDFGKQFDGMLKSIRSTINPEYGISEEHADNPVFERVRRLKDVLVEIRKTEKEFSDKIARLETNVSALIEEVSPLLDQASQQKSPLPSQKHARLNQSKKRTLKNSLSKNVSCGGWFISHFK